MYKRTDVINHIISKNRYKRYCEVGLQNAFQNFDKINCEYKISVDPDPNAFASFCMTSDEFFDNAAYAMGMNDRQIDCFFLDGLHSAEQLQKDFFNCLKYLSVSGCVIMHDTNPESEDLTHFPRDKKGTWNGSAYKFAAGLNCKKVTVSEDHGCTIVYKRDASTDIKEVSWQEFDKNRKQHLNLISWDEFVSM